MVNARELTSRSKFIKEFQQLLLNSPRYNLKQVQTENCDYSDTAVKSKNCYYCFGAFYCEDVLYGRYSRKCRDCSGVTLCLNCEGCIECSDCVNCYFAGHSQNCRDCQEIDFCEDCVNCHNCFGCIGLSRAAFCIFNEQVTESEYRLTIASLNLKEEAILRNITEQRELLRRQTPRIATQEYRTENCIGNQLAECANCYQCYDAFALEDCFYVVEANGNRDCCDLTVCFETELCYSCVHSPLNYNCNFLFQTDLSSDSEFCAFSKGLKHCFGCVYLENKEFHILNKPVRPDEYEGIVTMIRQELIAANAYNLSPYFASGYETTRMQTETDYVINTEII